MTVYPACSTYTKCPLLKKNFETKGFFHVTVCLGAYLKKFKGIKISAFLKNANYLCVLL